MTTDNTTQPTGMEATLKSLDTEEPIDIYFYRPVGYCWALLFRRLGIHPNAVTIASIFLGVGAGVCYYFPNLWIIVLGIFLLMWANSFDSADGQLARMTKQFTPLGRALDGFAGDVWFFAIYAAICLRLMPVWGYWIWGLAAVAGYAHSRQAAIADYYRNIHLYFLKGKAGSELDNSQALQEKYKGLTWRHNWFDKMWTMFYLSYTKGQESWTPRFQKLIALLKEKYGESIPDDFRAAFRQKSKPLMKYTNILCFNTRAIVLWITLLIDMPWIYFTFELSVLVAILIYMICRHEKICRQFTEQLEAN